MSKPKTFRGLLTDFPAVKGSTGKTSTVPERIELLVEGEWNTPWHGHFEITPEDLQEYKEHAEAGVRKGIPIDLEHNTIGGAVGWMESFEIAPSSADPDKQALWCTQVDWTPKGEELITNREYRFFSPEFADEDYEDPENAGQFMDNVLIGGGLTNRPLFKGLAPIAASDGTQNGEKSLTASHKQNIIYLSEELQNMNLQDLLAKDPAELNAEEKAFIVEHKSELTDEQVTTLTEAGVLEAENDSDNDADNDNDNDADNDSDNDNDADNDNDSDNDNETPEAKAAREAAEKAGFKVISASDLKKLQADAKAGKQANDTLSRQASETHVASKLFNEKDGLKMPITAKDTVVEFYHGLSPKQRKQFNEIVDKLPNSKMFSDIGKDNSGLAEGSAADTLMKKANELVDKAKQANQELTLGSAVQQVLASDKALAKRYNEEKGNQ